MMLDEFREQATFNPLEEEQEQPAATVRALPRRARGPFLGMTPAQRFLVASMLLFITCLLGTFTLMMLEKVVLPIGLF